MLTHIAKDGQPRMVDISQKSVTARTATTQAVIEFPEGTLPADGQSEIHTKKGPVFQTAIIAGTQAAKRTADLIPFCHPLPLDAIDICIELHKANSIQIRCTVKTTHKTGVEMEALTGATTAALTIYDMCKSLSHDIVIREVKLIEKTGGKSDYRIPEDAQ